MIEYKQQWTYDIKRCQRAGIEVPRPVPHPVDIILDPSTGVARIEGLKTEEERARFDECIRRREKAQEQVSYYAGKFRRSRGEKMRRMYLEEWHWEQRPLNILNDIIPKRYKMELDDRSYRDGALRAGETLKEFAEDRKRA